MIERVDRLMKAVQLDIDDGNLRVELITRLLAVRELLDERRDQSSN